MHVKQFRIKDWTYCERLVWEVWCVSDMSASVCKILVEINILINKKKKAEGFMLMSIIFLINYSLYLPNTYLYIPIFNILFYISLIFCFISLNCAPPRLAMLFAVCSYTIFISIFVYVNKDLLLFTLGRWLFSL